MFLGEFGYELLNWQGVVRKFARTLTEGEAIVCCSRLGLEPLYESAERYLDIGGLPLYRRSRARTYFATLPIGAPSRWPNRLFDRALRASVERHARSQLGARDLRFVFSSGSTELRDCTFGCAPERDALDADIYDRLDAGQNVYRKLQADGSSRPALEARLGFSLDEPYVLVQMRTRRVGPQSAPVSAEPILRALAGRTRLVRLSFVTGRALDSRSAFAPGVPGVPCAVSRLSEQMELIAHARRCVFFTEGDIGSHLYVPPMMGQDVVAVAPRAVWGLGTAPLDYWHEHVFRFGGRIVRTDAEDVLSSHAAVETFTDAVLAH